MHAIDGRFRCDSFARQLDLIADIAGQIAKPGEDPSFADFEAERTGLIAPQHDHARGPAPAGLTDAALLD